MILAHDAQMDEFIDAASVGRVIIHPSSHIGARSVVLPGMKIRPRTIVWANSVISKSLPPDTVCAGNPAKGRLHPAGVLRQPQSGDGADKDFPLSAMWHPLDHAGRRC